MSISLAWNSNRVTNIHTPQPHCTPIVSLHRSFKTKQIKCNCRIWYDFIVALPLHNTLNYRWVISVSANVYARASYKHMNIVDKEVILFWKYWINGLLANYKLLLSFSRKDIINRFMTHCDLSGEFEFIN